MDLRNLLAKATGGEWVADDGEGYSVWRIWSEMAPTGSGNPGPLIATVIGDSPETDANAALIVALHNCADELLKVAETADRWRKRKGHGDDHDCDLCAALRALREKEGT